MIRGSKGPMQWGLDLCTYGLKMLSIEGHVDWCNGDELLICSGARASDVPEIPWSTVRGDATNTRPGRSFLDDERTRLPVNGKHWLFERRGQQPDGRRGFERIGTKTGLNSVEVEKYMANIAQFSGKLLVAAHERASNIFIEDGLVVLVTKYHKRVCIDWRRQGHSSVFAERVGRARIAIHHRWTVQRRVG
jgi:hypothetical protein